MSRRARLVAVVAMLTVVVAACDWPMFRSDPGHSYQGLYTLAHREREGVWGGATERERRRILRQRRKSA